MRMAIDSCTRKHHGCMACATARSTPPHYRCTPLLDGPSREAIQSSRADLGRLDFVGHDGAPSLPSKNSITAMASAYVLNNAPLWNIANTDSDLAATYAALILADEGLEITVRMLLSARQGGPGNDLNGD